MAIVIGVFVTGLLAGFTLGCRHTYRKCTEDLKMLIAETEARRAVRKASEKNTPYNE